MIWIRGSVATNWTLTSEFSLSLTVTLARSIVARKLAWVIRTSGEAMKRILLTLVGC